ncbi:hypothetical protein [Roseivirga pacifica]|uniref:hypothetical protein n=1 Tax=Roseivirga pacifica TaxID=1267423 RepID=UPI00227D0F0C|nr:hypothetical protein [Roseivirga pacifica]
MKNQLIILGLSIGLLACGSDDGPSAIDCSGEVCQATIASGETAVTVPSEIHGTFEMEYTYAENNSPIDLGTKATFAIAANSLIVSVDGEECYTIENAVERTSGSGNYIFKAECKADYAFNISQNTDGSLSEINLVPANGPGFYGQFTLVQ